MNTTYHWRTAATGLLVMLFTLLAAREIDRPFYGLHSWDAALAAWSARTHVKYGLGYTKGLTTLVVGNPPPAAPPRYLDHPHLHVLLDAASMALLGTNEVSLRLTALILTAACLPFLIALLRRVYDDETAVLAAFFYVIFPITSYFNASCWVHWVFPFALTAYWCYLVLLGGLRESPPPGRRHYVGLGAALFVLPQLTWFAVFYCAAIGSDYLLRCLSKRRWPERGLLATLVLAPLAGGLADLGVLFYGRSGDLRGLLGVYSQRFNAFGTPDRTAIKWLAVQWQMVQKNFTLPVVLLAGAYLAYRAFVVIRARGAEVDPGPRSRSFVHAWLFVVPGVAVLAVFPELFWLHHMEYSWLALPVALAAALGALQARDALLPHSPAAARGALFVIAAIICGFAARGINDYYAIRWKSPVEIELFKRLNKAMAPDETLLTYYDYFIQEFADKPGLFRPEIAWYLDRRMAAAQTMEDVETRAATRKFPYYLVDVTLAPAALIDRLKAKYPFEYVQGNPYRGKPHEFAEFPDQMIFDLQQRAGSPMTLSRGAPELMKIGVDALYPENNPGKAVVYFRRVLGENPEHLGANFQLAKALDMLNERAEARRCWTTTLALARRFSDAETAAVAEARLKQGR